MLLRQKIYGILAVIILLRSVVFFGKVRSTEKINTTVVVYGSTLGGTTAALTLAEQGIDTILISETGRVGGQATDSGLSAFDESRRNWENFGLYYELKEYLDITFPNDDEKNNGIGKAIVGPVTALPDHIEAFFLKKIREQSSLELLQGYTAIAVEKEKEVLTSVTLQSTTNPDETIEIAFDSIIDGTQTGKLYPIADVPYSVGLDSKSFTGEESTLPDVVREAFISGAEVNGKLVGNFGNLVQSVGMPIPLIDQGYRGVFIPPDSSSICWSASNENAYIQSSEILTSRIQLCSVHFTVQPDAKDTYELFFINHNNTAIEFTIDSPDWDEKLHIQRSVDPTEKFISLGTYDLTQSPLSVTFHSSEGGTSVEGLIASKTNMHQQSIVLDTNNAEERFTYTGLPSIEADLYLHTDEEIETINLSVNTTAYVASRIGPSTYYVPSVALSRKGNTLNTSVDAKAIFVPKKPHIPNVPITVDTTKKDQRSWTTTLQGGEIYTIFVDWPQRHWGTLTMHNTETGESILNRTFNARFTSAMGTPITHITIPEDGTYKITLRTSSKTLDITNAKPNVVLRSESNMLHERGNSPTIFGQRHVGVYDIWAQSKKGSEIAMRNNIWEENVFRKRSIQNQDSFHYMGKFILSSTNNIQIFGTHPINVIAIPNTDVDVYAMSLGETAIFPLGQVPFGRYDILAKTKQELEMNLEAESLVQEISLRPISGLNLTNTPLLHRSPLDVITVNNADNTDIAYLYEAIDPQEHELFFRAGFTVLEPYQEGELAENQRGFFQYRNIVSGESLFENNYVGDLPFDIGKSTLGVTLGLTPFNDLGPVTEEQLDTKELRDKAADRSYAYLYWLKYNLEQTQSMLGCNPDAFICDTRRISFLPTLHDTEDGFSPIPYIREARRLHTIDPITEQDLSMTHHTCKSEDCRDFCYDHPYVEAEICIDPDQKPIILDDALIAAYYPIDFHTFLSVEDTAKGYLRQFTDTMIEKGYMDESQQSALQYKTHAAPTQISLGALVPIDQANIYPASTNFGVSQIANASLRTHSTEISIGHAIGYALAYSIQNDVPLEEVYNDKEKMKELQHYLIDNGMIIYPVEDMYPGEFTTALQHMMAEGFTTLFTRYAGEPEEVLHLLYTIEPAKPITKIDNKLAQFVAGKSAANIRYDDIAIMLLSIQDPKLASLEEKRDTLKKNYALHYDIDSSDKTTERIMLEETVIRRDLYVAAYIKWLAEKAEPSEPNLLYSMLVERIVLYALLGLFIATAFLIKPKRTQL